MKKKLLVSLSVIGILLAGCGQKDPSNSTTTISKNSESSVVTSSETSSSSLSSASSSLSSSQSSSISSSSSSSSSISSSTSVEQKVTVNIINQSTRYCTINAITTQGYPGDDAEFTITMKEDYKFKGISASDNSGKTVELMDNDGTYLFEIPADGTIYVTVEADKIVKTQKLFISDPKGILTQAPAYVTVGGATPITDIVTGEGETYYRVTAGSKIRFYFPNKVNYSSLGLTFNNKNYTPGANSYVDIDMAPYAGDLRVEVYGTKVGSPLVANNSDHLTITFMNKTKTQYIDTVVTNTEYYVIVTSQDKDTYLLESLSLEYTNKGYSTSMTQSYSIDNMTETATGWEILRTSSAIATNEDGFMWTVTEDNMNKYAGEPFCGDYVAFTSFTYPYTDYNDLSLDLFRIAGSGKATYRSRSMRIRYFTIDENNVYSLKNKDQYYTEIMYYQDGCLVAGFNGSNDNFGTPFYTSATDSLSDDLYAIKMQPNTSVLDYSINAQAFTIDGVTHFVGVVSYQNSFYKAIYSRRDKERHVKDFFTDVTLDVMYGNSWKDDQSIYSIKKGENVLATIGFNGNGGNKHKTLLPAYGGKYLNGADQLVVCDGVSIYNGNIFVSSLAENGTTLTLKNSKSNLVIEINQTNKTFTVTSSETKTLNNGPFAGKKFRMQWNQGFINPDDGERYGYYIEFNSDEPKLSCVVDDCWNMDMTHNNQNYFGKTYGADYYYDETTHIITAMVLGFRDQFVIAQYEYRNGAIILVPDTLTGNQGMLSTNEFTLAEVA